MAPTSAGIVIAPGATLTYNGSTNTVAANASGNFTAQGGYQSQTTQYAAGPAFTVASFKDPAGASAQGNYTATINWSDGTPATAGTIAFNSTTVLFSVTGA